MPNFKPTILVSAVAFAMGFSTVVHAKSTSDDESSASLDPIVVTASKTEEKSSQVPARITIISKDEIEKNPILNLSDVLQKDAAIYIKQNGGLGQGTTLSLRGTNPNHTLLLKNGTSLNTANTLSPIYPELLDTTDLARIEILKGPASVQYGSDAIGGVIQMISATPKQNSAFLTGIYGENNTYKALVGTDLVTDNGLFAQIRGQRLESDGTSIFNTQPNGQKAGYDQKGYSTTLGFDNQKNIKTSITIEQNQGTNIYSDNGGILNSAQRQFKNRLITVNTEIKINAAFALAARYSNVQDQEHYLESSPYYADSSRNQGDIHAVWQLTTTQNILAGLSSDNSQYKDASILNGKQHIDSKGYYLQHQYITNKISTQLGVRVEDNQKFGTHTVEQAAIRYQLLPATSIYTNFGTAFRAPSLSELYYHYENPSWNYSSYGNTKLKPEESTSYEFGIDQQITDQLLASLSVYKTHIKNLISSISNANSSTYENTSKASFTGGELNLKWKQGDLFISSEYAYVQTKNEATGLAIAYRPAQSLTLTTGLENDTYGISTSLVARSHANTTNTVNSEEVPGYATVDLNAFWNINPNLKLFTNIQNIGDVRYKTVYNYDSWYINGGRQASVGMTLRY